MPDVAPRLRDLLAPLTGGELYLGAAAWIFASGRMGVDQLLLRRPG